MQAFQVRSGRTFPLGSTYDGNGVNFALFSANAEKIELCLFDERGIREIARIPIEQHVGNIWCVYVENLRPNQLYGYRVYGEYKPTEGKRFNPNKLLIDPYAKKLVGELIWHKAIFGYDPDSPQADLSFSTLDSAPYVPKSIVIDDSAPFDDDIRPDQKFNQSIIYETHIVDLTKLFPKINNAERGTFLGMTNPFIGQYLKWLGVTAVELMPVHSFFGHKISQERINHWGYETLNFFAPENAYLVNGDPNEFRQMVRALHQRGLEVILDVVYNHTGEGNHLGPTLCYRGIDNESYYTLDKNNKRFYYDSTGCGALFNLQNPYVLTLVMDSLRYWAEKMHVDGFRLDLGVSLSRTNTAFSQESAFLTSARQDPVLRRVKMIVEPWDIGFDGYQIGAFPPSWAEWNDRFRDVVRRFWRGDDRQIGEFASRLAGSSDIFGYADRPIWSSINFITAHDGQTLTDLVSYNKKHNHANRENNRDGSDQNWSSNGGVEGYTEDPTIRRIRLERRKALMATLLLAFGTPMIRAGDELGQTHFGNNNPYCQDNVLNYLVWEGISAEDRDFARYVRKLIRIRRRFDVFSRTSFFKGQKTTRKDFKDLAWYDENGREFTNEAWSDPKRRAISYLVAGESELLLCIFNAQDQNISWKLPTLKKTKQWTLLSDGSLESEVKPPLGSGKKIEISARSVMIISISTEK